MFGTYVWEDVWDQNSFVCEEMVVVVAIVICEVVIMVVVVVVVVAAVFSEVVAVVVVVPKMVVKGKYKPHQLLTSTEVHLGVCRQAVQTEDVTSKCRIKTEAVYEYTQTHTYIHTHYQSIT